MDASPTWNLQNTRNALYFVQNIDFDGQSIFYQTFWYKIKKTASFKKQLSFAIFSRQNDLIFNLVITTLLCGFQHSIPFQMLHRRLEAVVFCKTLHQTNCILRVFCAVNFPPFKTFWTPVRPSSLYFNRKKVEKCMKLKLISAVLILI